MRRAVFLALALAGCADPPPSVPQRDAGPRVREDAATVLVDAAYQRPDGGPRLPVADVEVVLPYLAPAQTVPLEVGADLGTLDVFLSIDTTGSFGGEIDELQHDLVSSVVPALHARVPDVAFGVGRFEDFPTSPYGATSDRPFRLLAAITTELDRVGSAVARLDQPLGLGGDVPESGAEALWQIATGDGYASDGISLVTPFRASASAISPGGVGFRDGALRVVVHVTDAVSHSPGDYDASYPGTHSLDEAAEALRAIDARVIGIASGPSPRIELERLAIRTGAVAPPDGGECHTGIRGSARAPVSGTCPLVFDIDESGGGLSDAIVDAIGDLLDTVTWREVWGEALEDGVGFVQAIRALEASVPAGSTPPVLDDRRPAGDGIDDTFLDVHPGADVRFEIVLRNESIPPADYDQVFRVVVQILGDRLTLVERSIRIIVPAQRPTSDAGVDAAADLDAAAPDAAADLDAAAPDAAADLDAAAPDAG